MSRTLQIDFVSDIACPWCAVGLSSLQIALERLSGEVDAKLVMHPFELNPNMPPEGEDLIGHIGRKYGSTPEQVVQAQAALRERGAAVGFEFGKRPRIYNTFDAHRLLHWAGLEGRQLELKQALLRAYHTDGKDPGDTEVLVEAARSAGLDADAAREVIVSKRYADEVRAEEQEYQAMGIQSVPSIIFDQRYLISGGQPPEAFEQAIRQILAESAA